MEMRRTEGTQGDVPNVERLLRIRAWAQKDLAERTGLGRTVINQLITGKRKNPTLGTLRLIAEQLGGSIDALVDRQLSDLELHTHLSRAALRAAVRGGVREDSRFAAFIGTPEAPVSVAEWERLARILEVAEPHGKPLRRRRRASAQRPLAGGDSKSASEDDIMLAKGR